MRTKRLEAKNLTVFDDIQMDFSDGINVLIGENGTGKTHILKLLYSACKSASGDGGATFSENLLHTFPLSSYGLCSLISEWPEYKEPEYATCRIIAESDSGEQDYIEYQICEQFPKNNTGKQTMRIDDGSGIYLPTNNILEDGVHEIVDDNGEYGWDETHTFHDDLVAYLLEKQKPAEDIEFNSELLMRIGEITSHVKRYLNWPFGTCEIKFAILKRLIENGSIKRGSVLLWEEPDAHLGPKLIKLLTPIIYELHRIGVQVFITTHNCLFAEHMSIWRGDDTSMLFHSLYKQDGSVLVKSAEDVYELPYHKVWRRY